MTISTCRLFCRLFKNHNSDGNCGKYFSKNKNKNVDFLGEGFTCEREDSATNSRHEIKNLRSMIGSKSELDIAEKRRKSHYN